MDKPII